MKVSTHLSKVSKIFHISDVHIRNYTRKKEYNEVFDKLYLIIKELKDDNSIVVFTGDLFHSKTDISPESVQLAGDFLLQLANIAPTIVIPGNHDAIVKNKHRLDAITPVVNHLDHSNLYYWKNNGVYDFADLTFSHMSVFSKKDDFVLAKDINTANKKIALYHGTVFGSKTDIGYSFTTDAIDLETFDGFDLTLLGDVHKPAQYLNQEKTIAYPGSLIQQNHGEALEHGIIVWNLEDSTSDFVIIPNDYGYVSIDLINGELQKGWEITTPPKARVLVNSKDSTISQIEQAKKVITSKIPTVEVSISASNTNAIKNEEFNKKVTDVTDVEIQNDLFEDYLISSNNIESKEILEALLNLNLELNKDVDSTLNLGNTYWEPISFEFSNTFSYGTDNFIDFSNMGGFTGIFAPNAAGKSSIADSLIYCLFDKCSRTSKASNVLNKSKDHFYCSLVFDLNGVRYQVERIGKRTSKSVKVEVNFYQFDSDGDKISLNGTQRSDTNNIIRNLIGDYDTFILTNVILQSETTDFINSTQKTRKEFLGKSLNLSFFDNLYSLANEKLKEVKNALKLYQSKNILEAISDVEAAFLQADKVLVEKQKEQKAFLSQVESLEQQRETIQSQIKTVEIQYDVSFLVKKLEEISTQLSEFRIKLGSGNSILEKHQKEKLIIEGSLKTEEHYQHLLSLRDEKRTYEVKLDDLRREKKVYERDIKESEKVVVELSNHQYDENCKYCVDNPFVKNALVKKEQLPTLKQGLESLETTIKVFEERTQELNYLDPAIEDVESARTEYLKIVSNIELLESKNKSIEVQIESLLENQLTYKANLEDAIKLKDIIEANKKHKEDLINVEHTLKSLRQQQDKTVYELSNLMAKKEVLKEKIKSLEEEYAKYKELEEEEKLLKLYSSVVKYDGLPYKLLTDVIPLIQLEANQILLEMVDFSLEFDLDSDNIDIYIKYSDDKFWPIELGSGMERFMSSISIRMALIKNSNLFKPSFMIIDEGFGSLDFDKLNSIGKLFDYLKNEFKFILCISHLGVMRDLVDQTIDINFINGFSNVDYR